MNLPGKHSRFRVSSALSRKAQGCGCDSQLPHLTQFTRVALRSPGRQAARTPAPCSLPLMLQYLCLTPMILSGVLRRNVCSPCHLQL